MASANEIPSNNNNYFKMKVFHQPMSRMSWYTLSFTVPHKKKSSGDRSGERAGHCTWIVASIVVVVCLHVKTATTQHTTCTDVSRLSFCLFVVILLVHWKQNKKRQDQQRPVLRMTHKRSKHVNQALVYS
ncbi:hypothetical protein ANN_08969 [Periplaneta americana]|uniref:Uncharacterized protein n=1 Tax=Periplaneta americana TaxID=6978 RepID=A0ABQ8T4Z4_PERAM|nr:hypothetical protein ANN_08969 [Periplaneta americana]